MVSQQKNDYFSENTFHFICLDLQIMVLFLSLSNVFGLILIKNPNLKNRIMEIFTNISQLLIKIIFDLILLQHRYPLGQKVSSKEDIER